MPVLPPTCSRQCYDQLPPSPMIVRPVVRGDVHGVGEGCDGHGSGETVATLCCKLEER